MFTRLFGLSSSRDEKVRQKQMVIVKKLRDRRMNDYRDSGYMGDVLDFYELNDRYTRLLGK